MQPPVTPTTQPARNDALFAPARADKSIKMIAMIGIGLIATPIANGRTSPIA